MLVVARVVQVFITVLNVWFSSSERPTWHSVMTWEVDWGGGSWGGDVCVSMAGCICYGRSQHCKAIFLNYSLLLTHDDVLVLLCSCLVRVTTAELGSQFFSCGSCSCLQRVLEPCWTGRSSDAPWWPPASSPHFIFFTSRPSEPVCHIITSFLMVL